MRILGVYISCREIMASEAKVTPEEAIVNLKPIIKFLNEHSVPWQGHKLTFNYSELNTIYSGTIFIEKEYCTLIKIFRNGEVFRNYISLIDVKL